MLFSITKRCATCHGLYRVRQRRYRKSFFDMPLFETRGFRILLELCAPC